MRTIKKLKFLMLGAMILLTFVFSAQAQTVKRVRFQKGQSSVSFKGSLPRTETNYDEYLLQARKGQTLSVKLITDDPEAFFIVYETKVLVPDEEIQTPEGRNVRQWSGRLPVTSEYSVQVYGTDDLNKESTGKSYTLEITVK